MEEIIIVAPHPDDEIIGCYEILKGEKKPIIIYGGETDSKRREEVKNVKKFFDIKIQMFQINVPANLLQKENKFYFPDPSNEVHPLHRAYGFQGESMARMGLDVTFYTTLMNVPYIHEVADPGDKKMLLESCYPSQADLWKYDHKYFLFEGYYKWIF
jgi:hypothetical protein